MAKGAHSGFGPDFEPQVSPFLYEVRSVPGVSRVSVWIPGTRGCGLIRGKGLCGCEGAVRGSKSGLRVDSHPRTSVLTRNELGAEEAGGRRQRGTATSRGMPGATTAGTDKGGPSRAEGIGGPKCFWSPHLHVSQFLLFEIRTLLKAWPFAPGALGNGTVASVLKVSVSPSLKWVQM